MTALLIFAWMLGAVAVWLLFRPLVALSPAGRRALPIVAVFWPVFAALAMVLGLVLLVELVADEALVAVFGRDGDGK